MDNSLIFSALDAFTFLLSKKPTPKREPLVNSWKTVEDVPVTSAQSDAFSKDLKKRGFKFVGSTIIYAHMQAVGMVIDHTIDCFRYTELVDAIHTQTK